LKIILVKALKKRTSGRRGFAKGREGKTDKGGIEKKGRAQSKEGIQRGGNAASQGIHKLVNQANGNKKTQKDPCTGEEGGEKKKTRVGGTKQELRRPQNDKQLLRKIVLHVMSRAKEDWVTRAGKRKGRTRGTCEGKRVQEKNIKHKSHGNGCARQIATKDNLRCGNSLKFSLRTRKGKTDRRDRDRRERTFERQRAWRDELKAYSPAKTKRWCTKSDFRTRTGWGG